MGGSSGSSSGSSSGMGFENISSTYTPNPQAMAAYNQTLNMAENLAQAPYQPYTGQMIAGFTPDQMAAFQGVQNLQGYMQPYTTAGANAEIAAMNYANPANYTAQALQQYYNPYQSSVIQSTQNLMNQQNAMQQQQLLGTANTQAGGAQFNDRTGIAQAALAGQQALANNQILANLEQQGYQNAQQQYNQQQQQAIAANQAAAYGLGQLGLQGQQGTLQELQALLGTGGQQQQLAQQQLSGAYQQFLNAQAWPYQQTAFLADIASGIGPSMGGTTQTTGFGQNMGQQQSSQSSMSGSASGLGSLLGMLPMMFSDEEDKTDIQKLSDGDVPMYAYRYKGDPKSYPKVVGPMAQDVEKHHPDLVHEVGGHKVVRMASGGTPVANPAGGNYYSGNIAANVLGADAAANAASAPAQISDPLAPTDPTQSSNTGFGNIGYTPASFLNPNEATGFAAILDPQSASQMAQSRWMSNKYEPESEQQYADGGRVGLAQGGNPNVLPDLQNIYGGNPLFMGFGSLIDNKTMPYIGTKLPEIHGKPSPIPSTPSMGFIPHGPAHAPSGGGGGGGGGGEGGGGGGGKPPKPADKNTNQPLGGGDGSDGGDGGPAPGITSSPDAPALSMNMGAPTGETVGNPPGDVGGTGLDALPLSPDVPLMAGGMDFGGFGGFADGGRVGYDTGGSPSLAANTSLPYTPGGGAGSTPSLVGNYAPFAQNNNYNQDVLRNMQNLNYNFTQNPFTPAPNGYFNSNPMEGFAQGQSPVFAFSPFQAPSQATPYTPQVAQAALAGEGLGTNPYSGGDNGVAARALAGESNMSRGGRAGYAGGGGPAVAGPSAPGGGLGLGGLGNLGVYSPTDENPLAAAGNLGYENAPNLLGTKLPGTSFNDLANQWLSDHVIAADPTPESLGFPSMAKQTNPLTPRPELPSTEMIQTGGLSNLSNAIDPGIAAVFGGGSPMTALALAGSNHPGSAAAGAPFGGASPSDLQAQRDALLATPQPAAGYAQGNLDYGRMTPEGLFGMTPVGYYTQPLFAKGGRVGKEGGGWMNDPAQLRSYLNRTRGIESGGRNNAVSSTGAAGPYQFIRSTAKRYGLIGPQGQDYRFDPVRSEAAATALAHDNYRDLSHRIGREPSPAELYLAHQQGPAGAAALINHPNMPAAHALVAGGAYRSLPAAQRAVNVNRTRSMGLNPTGQQFAGAFTDKFNRMGGQPTGMAPTQFAGNVNPATFGKTAQALGLTGRGPVAMEYANLQPTRGSFAPGSNLNRINPNDPSGPLLPLGNDQGLPVTQRVADVNKMIAQPPAQRRGLSLADFNPVGTAKASENPFLNSQGIGVKPPQQAWDANIPRIDKGPQVNPQPVTPMDFGSLTKSTAVDPARVQPSLGESYDQAFGARKAPNLAPLQSAPENVVAQDQDNVPTPPTRPAELSQQEEPGFFDQLGDAIGGFFGGDDKGAEANDQGPDLGQFFSDLGTDNSKNDNSGPDFDLGSLFDFGGGDEESHGGMVRQHHADGEMVEPELVQEPEAEEAPEEPADLYDHAETEAPSNDFSSLGAEPAAASEGFGPIAKDRNAYAPGSGSIWDQIENSDGGIFGAIGKGLGELFGIDEAEAAEAPQTRARPTGGASETARQLWGMAPSRGRSEMSAEDQLLADHRQLTNQVLTAPNALSRQAAQAALRANEFEINQRRLQRQAEMAYGLKQKTAETKAKAKEVFPDADWSKTGEEFIQTLPEGDQAYVRGLLNYTSEPPRGIKSNHYIRAAQQADPKWNQNTFKQVQDEVKEFNTTAPSKAGGQLIAGNTAMGHAAELAELLEQTGESSSPVWNRIANPVADWWGSKASEKRNAFYGLLDKYADEQTRFYKGTAGGAEERKEMRSRYNLDTHNPRQILELLREDQEAMRHKLTPLQERYDSVQNLVPETYRREMQIIGPQAATAEKRLNEVYDKHFYPGKKAAPVQRSEGPSVTRTGTFNGRKVIEYSDGSVKYAD